MAYDAGAIIARLLAKADGFLATMDKVDKRMDEQQKHAESLARGYKALTIAGAAIAGAVAAFTVAGLKSNAMVEQYAISFRVLLKDEKKATEAFEYLKDLADRTPFQMPEVVGAGRLLAAYGLEIKKYITNVLDLAAGMGIAADEVANAFGKLSSGATGEAMERLRYMGISAKDFIAEGIRFAKSGQLESTVDETMAALQRIIQNKFGGMVDEQAKTWNGLISTLKDTIAKFERETTAGLFATLKPGIKGLIDLLNSFGPTGTRVIGTLTLIAGALGLIVAGSAAWFAWNTRIAASMVNIKLAMGAVFTNPWILVIAGAVALAIAIKGVVDANRAAREENIKLGQSYLDLNDKLSKTKAGTQEHKELEDQHQKAMNDLAKAFPQVIREYDSLGNVRRIDIDLLQQLIDKENELERVRAENAGRELQRRIKRLQEQAKDVAVELSEIPTAKSALPPGVQPSAAEIGAAATRDVLRAKLEQINASIRKLNKEYNELISGGGRTAAGTPPPRTDGTRSISEIADKLRAEEDLAAKLYELAHTETETRLHEIALQVAAYKKQGLDETDIAEWEAYMKAQVYKDAADQEDKDAQQHADIQKSAFREASDAEYQKIMDSIGAEEELTEAKRREIQERLKLELAAAKATGDTAKVAALTKAMGELDKQTKTYWSDVGKAVSGTLDDLLRGNITILDMLKNAGDWAVKFFRDSVGAGIADAMRIAAEGGKFSFTKFFDALKQGFADVKKNLADLGITGDAGEALGGALFGAGVGAMVGGSPIAGAIGGLVGALLAPVLGIAVGVLSAIGGLLGGLFSQQKAEDPVNQLATLIAKYQQLLAIQQQFNISGGLLGHMAANALRELAAALGTALEDISNALADALADGGDKFTESFGKNLYSVMKNAIMKAFVAGEAMRPLLQTLSELTTQALLDSVLTETEIAAIQAQMALIGVAVQPLLDQLALLDAAFPAESGAATEAAKPAGIQIAHFTGPDRDLLVSLLSPLADLPNRFMQLIDTLLHLDSTISAWPMQMAAAGAGAGGVSWTVDTINVNLPSAPASPADFFTQTGDAAARNLGQGG